MFFLLQSSFWQKLEKLDQWLFIKINSDLTNPFFDSFIAFYALPAELGATLFISVCICCYSILKEKESGGFYFSVTTVALTDMTGTYVFKHSFERIRPCGDPDFFYHVRLLVNHCSGGYSFVSNHAANHFGMATFFFITCETSVENGPG